MVRRFWKIFASLAVIAPVLAGSTLYFAQGGSAAEAFSVPYPVRIGFSDTKPADAAPPLPPVEEAAARFVPLTFDEARKINASRPFSSLPNHPSAPFVSRLTGRDEEMALACLATAAIYEAGYGQSDQRAVMQVILNRVRHPAYPASVCEVVFQGSERKTGCQFTFACDGALDRWRPSQTALANAMELGRLMLSGALTDPRVGLATHYHTNWVVPYWSDSLDKVAVVGTHLFFRWKGYWGKKDAFRQTPAAKEAPVAKLAAYDPDYAELLAEGPDFSEKIDLAALAGGMEIVAPAAAQRPAQPSFQPTVIQLAEGAGPGRWALDAVARCEKKATCSVIGWATGRSECLQGYNQQCLRAAPPDFVYVQKLRDRVQQAYWNCEKWPKAATGGCLPHPAQTAALALGQI